MGNAIEKLDGGQKQKLLDHPHREQQIAQAFEHGNPVLLQQQCGVDIVDLLNCFPSTTPTPPKLAYLYCGIKYIREVNPSTTAKGTVPGKNGSTFLKAHPTPLYAYAIGACISDRHDPNMTDQYQQEAFSYPIEVDGNPIMLGLYIIELIRSSGMSMEEMGKAYPFEAPAIITDEITDEQLYWLVLSKRYRDATTVPDQQRERWRAAQVEADLYAHHIGLTSGDIYRMVPLILKRWHKLRTVASNYLMEVLAPYYANLFQFLYDHNILNDISQEDTNLLSLLYPDLLDDQDLSSQQMEQWTTGPDHVRSIKCLSYHSLYAALGKSIQMEFYHPLNQTLWRNELNELLRSEGSVSLLNRSNLAIGSSGVIELYYGSLSLSHSFKSRPKPIVGNTTDRTGEVSIEDYNPTDVVMIYDAELTTVYYFTRRELPELLTSKINPYNDEVLDDVQLDLFRDYLDWHLDNVLPVLPWAKQLEILHKGWWFHPQQAVYDKVMSYYIHGKEAVLLQQLTTGKYMVDAEAMKSIDHKGMFNATGEVINQLSENHPMKGNLEQIFGGIAGLMDTGVARVAPKDSKKVEQIED